MYLLCENSYGVDLLVKITTYTHRLKLCNWSYSKCQRQYCKV
jgi:hypothetical protein